MGFTIEAEILAKPRQVFAHLHDPELVRIWMPELVSVQYLSPNPRTSGARFQYLVRQFGQNMTVEGELLTFNEPSLLEVRLTTSRFSFDARYEVIEQSRGTRLIYTFELNEQSSLPRLLQKPFLKFMRHTAVNQIENLRRVCDGANQGSVEAEGI